MKLRCALAMLVIVAGGQALAGEKAVKIGVLGDQSGPYADLGGPGSVLAAQMAAEDYAGKVLGRPIEIIAADMLNKPDVAAAIASWWFDVEGVDAITDVPVTSVALAVQNVAFERKKIILITSPHDVSAFLLVAWMPSGVRRGCQGCTSSSRGWRG